jgi:hypothetical protein
MGIDHEQQLRGIRLAMKINSAALYKSLLLALAYLTCAVAVAGSPDVEVSCEQQWLVESAKYVDSEKPDYSGLLDSWLQLSGDCAKSERRVGKA